MPLEIFSPAHYSKRLVEDPLTPPAPPNNSQCIGAIVSDQRGAPKCTQKSLS